MKITVFTSNHPRHLSLIKDLLDIGEVHAIIECATRFPGAASDSMYHVSPVMADYFSRVLQAERDVFGPGNPIAANDRLHILPLTMGDLSRVPLSLIETALASDFYLVFGASFIRGPLIDFLVPKKAVNIHMGISPDYRGSSCNFWAAYERNFHLVGATIHMLTKGLDSGPILSHAFPAPATCPFKLGMLAVKSAHSSVCAALKTGRLFEGEPIPQDRSLERRYTKGTDFTDKVAQDYLNHFPSPEELMKQLQLRDLNAFVRPFVDSPGQIH